MIAMTRILVAAAAAATLACNNNPIAPTLSPRLEIVGPTSVGPAATAGFTALLDDRRGGVTDVTLRTQWESSAPDVLRVDSTGSAVGVSLGEVKLTGRFGELVQTHTVLVIPPGTSRLFGRVTHVDSMPIQGIAGAIVEVLKGTGLGLRVIANSQGNFVLYGVSGAIQLSVTAPGYLGRTIDLIVNAESQSPYFPLVPADGVPGSLSGRWSLTLVAPQCSFLPEAARLRQFAGEASHGSSHVILRLSSPTANPADLTGQFAGGILSLQLPYWPGDVLDGPWYGVLDLFQPPAVLGLRGDIRVSPESPDSPDSMTGLFDGSFDYYTNTPGSSAAACIGKGQVTMRRT